MGGLLPKDIAHLRVKQPREQKECVVETYEVGDKIHKRKHYIHYSNSYTNPLMPDKLRTALEQDAHTNPHIADTVLYGLDGNPEGAVYPMAHRWLMDIAPEPRDFIEYVGGVDYGVKDATAAVLIAFTKEYHQAVVLQEYYHQNSNRGARKGLPQYALEVVQFYAAMYEKYELHRQGALTIPVDYARRSLNDPQFHKLCNDTARSNGLEYLHFIPATKTKIEERIIMLNSLGESNKFNTTHQTPNLQRELESISFAEDKDIREDGDDHAINALEYGLTHRQNSIWNT